MSETSEEFATEPVPEDRTVPWVRVGLISAMVAFSLPTFVTGIEVATAVDGRTAIFAILAGNLLLSFIGAFTGSIGGTFMPMKRGRRSGPGGWSPSR